MITRLIAWLRRRACRHEFDMSQMEKTNIPIPPPPPDNASYEVHCDYLNTLHLHPAHTRRIVWPCAKCGKVFHAHCGLDILHNGTIIQRHARSS